MRSFRSGHGPSNRRTASTYQAGLAAYEAGRFHEAIRLLTSADNERGLSGTLARFYLSQAHMHQGVSDLRTGEHHKATQHFLAARRINPDSAGLSRYLAVCHIERGRFDLAADEFERTRIAGEEDGTLPIRLAHAFAKDGRLDRAVETLEEAIRNEPTRDDFLFQLGVLHASADDFDAAIGALQRAADFAPLDGDIQQHLGLAYGAAGKPVLAIDHLCLAQQLSPHDAHTALLLTLAARAAGDLGNHVAVAPAEAKAGPVDDEAIRKLGDAIIEDSDFIEAFLRLPESDVDHEVFAILAGILERALERHPDYADLHHHCSLIYRRLDRTQDAILAATEAIDINPQYVQALIQIARLYAETDQRDEAVERLRCAVEYGGDFPDVHFMLGQLYQKDGKTGEARMEFHRALALNSEYGLAKRALEELATA